MKLYTSFTSKAKSTTVIMAVSMALVMMPLFFIATTYQTITVSAKSKQQGLSTTKLGDFAQADILYYNPGECISGKKGSGAACGSTAEEIYWSTISKYNDDPIKIAGIIGNLVSEGGMNPVAWEGGPTYEGGGINSSGELYLGWDFYYDGNSSYTGVGAFAITSGLGSYLQYVNDNSDYIDYFKDTKEYSYNWLYHPEDCSTDAEHPVYGDCLLDKIGADVFSGLVEFEVEYAFGEHFKPSVTQEYWDTDFSSPSDAAYWWMDRWEIPGVRNAEDRERYAEDAYDMYKDFTCSSSSSKTTSSSGDSSSSDKNTNNTDNSNNTSTNATSTVKATTNTISVANNSTNSDSTESKSSSSTVSGSDITWIGDSYSVGAQSIIEEKYPGISFGGSVNDSSSTIQGSKRVSSGDSSNPSCLTILQDVIDADNLKPHLVFACGTNGGWLDDDVSKFQEMIKGKNTKAVVVTSKIPKDDYAKSNKRLEEMADSNDDISLADWTTVYEESYFDSDPEKIHPTTEPGYEKWVGVISEALEGSGGCSSASYEGDYPEYRQYDDPWGGLPYGPNNGDNGKWNYGNSGCGATSMAVIATMTSGQDVFPTDITDTLTEKESQITEGSKWYDSGYMRILDPLVCEEYGCEAKQIDTTADEIRQYLQDGWFIHTSGGGSKGTCSSGHSSTCPYSAEGHFVALLDIDNNDNVTIEDPGWGDTAIQTYKLSDIVDSIGAAVAIRGNGNNSDICDTGNICGDSGSSKTTGTSGYKTAEDAKHIIDEYLDADMSGYSLMDPGTQNGVKDNCVAFSCWFITNYTEISYPGGVTGEGNQFVDVFYSAKKDEYPDLEISDTPTVYSVAQWSDSSILARSSNHTGIVIGIDEANDMILIAEAAWANPCFTGIHGDGVGYGPVCEHSMTTAKYSLSSATGGSSKYINLNKYLKSNTGLQ